MNKLAAFQMMGAILASGAMQNQSPQYEPIKETSEERKKRLDEAERARYTAQGLTQFFYGVDYVWALNKKNADKKARKMGYI